MYMRQPSFAVITHHDHRLENNSYFARHLLFTDIGASSNPRITASSTYWFAIIGSGRKLWITYLNDILSSSTTKFVVTEKAGRVKWFTEGALQSSGILLDLTDAVYSAGWEEGLLSMAFDPDYVNNRYAYVFYSLDNPKRSRLSRFTVNLDNIAGRSSELTLLEIPKTSDSHNGGMLQFGTDGFLYISVSDGYQVDDAQDLSDLKGGLLRLDTRNASEKAPYEIPPDNPFANNNEGIRPEILASGFRNP